jgi:hypothetical protein
MGTHNRRQGWEIDGDEPAWRRHDRDVEERVTESRARRFWKRKQEQDRRRAETTSKPPPGGSP